MMGQPTDDKDPTAAAFRADVAKAFGAIGTAIEVAQANVFITRALVDLLDQRGILALAEVREQVLVVTQAAALTPGVVSALGQLLADEGPGIPVLLQ